MLKEDIEIDDDDDDDDDNDDDDGESCLGWSRCIVLLAAALEGNKSCVVVQRLIE